VKGVLDGIRALSQRPAPKLAEDQMNERTASNAEVAGVADVCLTHSVTTVTACFTTLF
jgi:hypothetical protein